MYRIPENESFADAFRVHRDGDTVTVVNAPTVEQLADVHAPEGAPHQSPDTSSSIQSPNGSSTSASSNRSIHGTS